MNNISELQELWGTQETLQEFVPAEDKLPDFIKKLKKYERFQNKANILKLAGIILALINIVYSI